MKIFHIWVNYCTVEIDERAHSVIFLLFVWS
jgi:hypothetical protein